MRTLAGVAAAAGLVVALGACAGAAPVARSTPKASAAPSAAPTDGTPQLTGQACAALTAADVQSALGVPVQQLPMTAPPPGGGPGGSLISGCTYTSGSGADAGATLLLFHDEPISVFASAPGYQPVTGVGDQAYVAAPVIVGQKGSTTFQLMLVSPADQATQTRLLRRLGAVVAGRL